MTVILGPSNTARLGKRASKKGVERMLEGASYILDQKLSWEATEIPGKCKY